ncbi:MAG: acyl carrier protein, partial [Planctomycetota bacterium]
AFAWLANGHSIGKVVLSIAHADGRAAAAPPRSRTRLASSAIPPPARREVAAIATATPPGLRAAVRAAVAAVLGFPDPEHLAADRPFRDYGLDSLLAIDAKDRIEPLVGCDLPANLLFDFPDLDQLVAHLHALLDRQARAPTNATASTSTRKP